MQLFVNYVYTFYLFIERCEGYGVGIDKKFTLIFVKVSTKIGKVMSPFWHVLM
jgi:hypothetical protein